MFYEGRANACCALPELQVHRAPRGSGLANTGQPARLQSVLIHTEPVQPKASHPCRTLETGVKCTRRVMTVKTCRNNGRERALSSQHAERVFFIHSKDTSITIIYSGRFAKLKLNDVLKT